MGIPVCGSGCPTGSRTISDFAEESERVTGWTMRTEPTKAEMVT